MIESGWAFAFESANAPANPLLPKVFISRDEPQITGRNDLSCEQTASAPPLGGPWITWLRVTKWMRETRLQFPDR